MGPGGDRRTIGETGGPGMGKWEQWRDRDGRTGREVGQRDQGWDRRTLDGTAGPEVGQEDYRWDTGQEDYR